MRVLLVEDDPATAQGIEMMLRSESYVCDVTDMGEDALEIGKLYDYDIIILDLMLPDMDGYQVLRRLRAARVKTPVLILSGLNGLDDKIKGLRTSRCRWRSISPPAAPAPAWRRPTGPRPGWGTGRTRRFRSPAGWWGPSGRPWRPRKSPK